MSAAVKYTLARLGLFLAVFAALWFVPVISLPVKLMIAIVVSAAAGWFLLRNLRDDVSAQVEGAVDRRREQKEHLRAALAGDDVPAEAEPEKSHS
ncbi:hypothetical protein Cs7R123_79200 [Catellatospora sp. TT07R-123]|uniref:DUF4229 domain-containing protein n=1 Tax=Catellatospora sp. TT07R-123 TaxID=2733863 RepID=UPI001B2AB46C|nr:DUF4229 domain-containing protein [Catellatospora sp. TT07R-123]GHJ50578.1 hypothetical protein Cs7R123_79200 [Catellatospora sp. TT07R-123]